MPAGNGSVSDVVGHGTDCVGRVVVPAAVPSSTTKLVGAHPVSAGVQAIVTLGDAVAAEQGLCGESAYAAADCRFNAPQNKLTCRR